MAIIPVENSAVGRISETYNALPKLGLYIVGEHFLPINMHLMMTNKAVKGNPPSNLNDEELVAWKMAKPSDKDKKYAMSQVVEIRSHEQGLLQSKKYLSKNFPNVKQTISWDTAGSARELAQEKLSNVAVIAPKSATRYDLTIVDEDIEDDKNNTTRFLILAKEMKKEFNAPVITTLVFSTPHVSGALVKALDVFNRYNVNLTKLETYMTGTHHEKPVFYIDAGFNGFDDKGMMKELKEVTEEIKMLGCYEASNLRTAESGFSPV
ncbi:MAG: P-protein [Alphaproteobacteria bacterium ADurb.Bin438]|nr:MAG: P-protein [Alphaproteobacteria bacterium ADurb.Bin438]